MELYILALFMLGRILFGGFFLYSGINHFVNWDRTRDYTASKNIPMPAFSLAIGSLFLVFGGAGIIVGAATQWAIFAIVSFLLTASFTVHTYWRFDDLLLKMSERINFMKNMALIGAALALLAIPTPWALALG